MVRKSTHIPEQHPSVIVSEIIDRYGRELQFEFGMYRYESGNATDDRYFIFIDPCDVKPSLATDLIDMLPPDRELAFHSRVRSSSGKIRHIPMIDFGSQFNGVFSDNSNRVLEINARDFPTGFGTTLLCYRAFN